MDPTVTKLKKIQNSANIQEQQLKDFSAQRGADYLKEIVDSPAFNNFMTQQIVKQARTDRFSFCFSTYHFYDHPSVSRDVKTCIQSTLNSDCRKWQEIFGLNEIGGICAKKL